MNELIELWIAVTKGREIEEFESDVQKLYDYTMNLQKENERLKEDIKDVDIWNKLYNEQFDKNRKLEDNWNELKRWIDNEIEKEHHTRHWDVQHKMQELERGISDVED